MIINTENSILGRVATYAAKQALLGEDSYISLMLPEGNLCVERTGGKGGSPISVEIFLPVSTQHIDIKGVKRRWTHKELMQAWKVPPMKRHRYLAVSLNHVVEGLFDGRRVIRPDHKGEISECKDLPVRLYYC